MFRSVVLRGTGVPAPPEVRDFLQICVILVHLINYKSMRTVKVFVAPDLSAKCGLPPSPLFDFASDAAVYDCTAKCIKRFATSTGSSFSQNI